MPQRPYFVLVLAHSLHGRLRRVYISHRAVYLSLAAVLIGSLSVFGILSSYVRMSWKVANYNSLSQEVASLRSQYQELQSVTNQTNVQLATLESLAGEVSLAYGLQREAETSAGDKAVAANLHESLSEYNLLQTASISSLQRNYPRQWQRNTRPSLWPVEGRLLSSFGGRNDPLSSEGSIHTGIDLAAPKGTPVRAAADGIVIHADWSAGYGRLVKIDHGNGLQTWYGYLSRIDLVAGQEVRRGEQIGESGGSRRATPPHLHFEVRLRGTPMNPYPYLASGAFATMKRGSTSQAF